MRGADIGLTAVDLFAGAGGLTLGLKHAGYRVVGAIEIDDLAAETYRSNHREVHLVEDDIRNVDPATFIEAAGLGPTQRLDLLAGCPPCQGFSSVRTLNGSRSVADERNDLISEYARFVAALRPRSVLMENVPALAGDKRMKSLVTLLEEMGYPVSGAVAVMNAADFGVPQRRRRLVLVAAEGASVPSPQTMSDHVTVRHAIGSIPAPGNSGDPLHDLPERRSPGVMARIRAIPKNGGSRLDLPRKDQLVCHRSITGFKDVYGRMAWDRPAPTITGGCHNPSKGRFLHPDENRAITLREAALLQGFPPDYRFSLRKGKLAAAAMIGNALPPSFVEAHARAIASVLTAAG